MAEQDTSSGALGRPLPLFDPAPSDSASAAQQVLYVCVCVQMRQHMKVYIHYKVVYTVHMYTDSSSVYVSQGSL